MKHQLVTTLLLLAYVNADSSVHILSTKYGYDQLVTSSILNWVPGKHYTSSKDFVIGGVINVDADDSSSGRQRPIFVCRALHNGNWVAGGQKQGEKRCQVTLTGNVRSYENYQLLENVESAARISWNDWSKYYRPPVGSVSTDKLYIARYDARDDQQEDGRRPRQTYYIGTLNSEDSLGTITYVKENEKEGTADKGQLLVETEPISYNLNGVKFIHTKRRVTKREPRVLAQTTIVNPGSRPAIMAEAVTYTYVETIYWGQGHAMLKGLNTSIVSHNKTKLLDMNWGLEIKQNRTNVYTVETYLEPGTAVNVTLKADYANVEVPYSGKLFSHYEDGASINPRIIGGTRHEKTYVDVTPVFGPVYYVGNYSLAPTTEPPPTITTIATESSIRLTKPTNNERFSTKAVVQQQQYTEIDEDHRQNMRDDNGIDENAILKKRPEITSAGIGGGGMQGDDGGPLSLKDKPEHSRASTSFFIVLESLLLLVISFVLARIT